MEITDLLRRAYDGDAEALRSLIPLVYDELKNLASSHLRREHSPAALQTTVLVHEAYLRLAESRIPDCENRSHFFGIAARIMRQVLVDMARARGASKRGPGLEFPLAELPDFGVPQDEAFLALNDALDLLARDNPLKGQLIELRFFAGWTAEESATALSLPVKTVRRELRVAKAWLHSELASTFGQENQAR